MPTNFLPELVAGELVTEEAKGLDTVVGEIVPRPAFFSLAFSHSAIEPLNWEEEEAEEAEASRTEEPQEEPSATESSKIDDLNTAINNIVDEFNKIYTKTQARALVKPEIRDAISRILILPTQVEKRCDELRTHLQQWRTQEELVLAIKVLHVCPITRRRTFNNPGDVLKKTLEDLATAPSKAAEHLSQKKAAPIFTSSVRVELDRLSKEEETTPSPF